MFPIKPLVWLFVTLFLFILAFGALPESQITALQDFYDSLNGHEWSNCTWNFTEFQFHDSLWNLSICGLKIERSRNLDTVTALDFTQNNLNGTLPDSVFEGLPDLEKIRFVAEASLRGAIPNICSSTNLWYINMEANFSGTVPHCIGNMSTLKSFALGCWPDNCPLRFDDIIIEMWCKNGNDITSLWFQHIDYKFSCHHIFFVNCVFHSVFTISTLHVSRSKEGRFRSVSGANSIICNTSLSNIFLV